MRHLLKTAHKKIFIILSLAVIILAAFSSSSPAADHAVILQYHHFGEGTPASTSVTMEQFRNHLQYLKKNDFNLLSLEKIILLLKERKQLPDNCAAITVDDAYTSVYRRALPLLKKYGYPFTVFVNTEGVQNGIKSYMTWEQMREMQKSGASFASHSHTHDYLIKRRSDEGPDEWRDRIKQDIWTSLQILKEELGSESFLFAYPYGEYNNELREIIIELKLAGFGQQSGAVWQGSDFAALPRFPMAGSYADMEQFTVKVRSLPLPVISAEPDNPVLPDKNATPVLELRLAPGEYREDTLKCYAGGQGRIKAIWTDKKNRVVEVTPNKPLPAGRSRYNCTALHNKEKRYFWYSHLWIRGKY